MAGLDSCSLSDGEPLNTYDGITEDSQNEREELREGIIISDETLNTMFEYFDATFSDNEYDNYDQAYGSLFRGVSRVLLESGYQFRDNNSIPYSEVDQLFVRSGLSPMSVSTIILQDQEGNFKIGGSISRLTCNLNVDTAYYTPQDVFPLEANIQISLYGEELYNFSPSITKLGAFTLPNNVHIMTASIEQSNEGKSRQELDDIIDSTIANELGHYQFHEVIEPYYEINGESIFTYQGTEFTSQQVNELWSDYSSFMMSFKLSLESGDNSQVYAELRKILFLTKGISSYDLTREFWYDLVDVHRELDKVADNAMQGIQIILESAKN